VRSERLAVGLLQGYVPAEERRTNAVGAMIVAGPEGLTKNAYRKFTIRGAPPPGARVLAESVAGGLARGAGVGDAGLDGGHTPDGDAGGASAAWPA